MVQGYEYRLRLDTLNDFEENEGKKIEISKPEESGKAPFV